ncbi:MAG: serine/threonine protein kinase [Bryobacteraceae bacterium]
MVGRTVGNFRIVEKLGQGGMGSVYRAVDQMVQRNVAIKILRPDVASDPETWDRFHSEAVALAKLNHPSIAMLYSFFHEGDEYFMVQEFVPGRNLEQVIQTHGALDWRHACGIMLGVLDGMRHAHEQGIVHRDLKPANIMLTPDGAVKITDFGIARLFFGPKVTRGPRVLGTVEYIAPERVQGKKADERSDVYSLGIVLYEMVAGRLPFNANTDFDLMRAQMEDRPRPLAEWGVFIPAAVERSIMVALEKDPANRHQSAAIFADDLRWAVQSSGVALQDLGPATYASPRETVAIPPFPETLSRPPVEAASVPPAPRETAYAAPPMMTANAALARETVVVPPPPPPPPVPAATGVKRSAAIRGLIMGVLPALVLGGLAAWHYLRPLYQKTPEPPVSGAPSSSLAVADGNGTASNGAAPGPSPKLPGQPNEPPPNPEDRPAPPSPEGNTPPAPPAVQPVEPSPKTPAEGAATPEATSLAAVKTLYLRPANPDLDDLLREELKTELEGRISLATTASEAEAIMDVVIEDQHGNAVSGAAGRVVGLKGTRKAIITIQDRSGKHVLWQAEVDNKHSLVTAMRDDTRRLASRIAKRLRSELP